MASRKHRRSRREKDRASRAARHSKTPQSAVVRRIASTLRSSENADWQGRVARQRQDAISDFIEATKWVRSDDRVADPNFSRVSVSARADRVRLWSQPATVSRRSEGLVGGVLLSQVLRQGEARLRSGQDRRATQSDREAIRLAAERHRQRQEHEFHSADKTRDSDANNCKARPEYTKGRRPGGGASRSFIPWCDRKG